MFLTPTTPNFLATSSKTGFVRRSHLRPPIFIVPSLLYVIFVFFVFSTVFFLDGFLFGFLKQQSYPCGFFRTSKPSLHGGCLGLGHVEACFFKRLISLAGALTFLFTKPIVYPKSCIFLTSSTPVEYAFSSLSGSFSPCICTIPAPSLSVLEERM